MSESEDLGPPAVELKELDEAPGGDFVQGIRGRIHRRLFASDSVDFAFRIFFETLFDYLDLIMRSIADVASPRTKEKD